MEVGPVATANETLLVLVVICLRPLEKDRY